MGAWPQCSFKKGHNRVTQPSIPANEDTWHMPYGNMCSRQISAGEGGGGHSSIPYSWSKSRGNPTLFGIGYSKLRS